MNSGLMTDTYVALENFIDDLESFHRYRSWILSGNKHNILVTNATQVSTTKLDVGSNSHVFTNITMFTYIRPVKCNVKILNGRKTPAKVLGFVIV